MTRPRIVSGLILACFTLGVWLRLHQLGVQVVQDDEWHAIHKLLTDSPRGILTTFGVADHSIPLTLFYWYLAAAVGLDEVNMRIVQVATGGLLVLLCARLAWSVTRDAATTGLTALLLAVSPFLVLYSRTSRPYAITTLLVVMGLAWLWQWRRQPNGARAGGIIVCAALAAWLHPLTVLYFAVGFMFLIAEAAAARPFDARRLSREIAVAAAAAVATVALLAPPVLNDFAALAGKAGRDAPDPFTLFRVFALFGGGLPDAATALVTILAGYGAWRTVRSEARLGIFLVLVFLVPIVAVAGLGGHWSHQGHTFARYVMPSFAVFLFWLAYGVTQALRGANRAPVRLAPISALAIAYLATIPTFGQVLRLGPWYGHLYHHFDYVPLHNHAATQYVAFRAPDFYAQLAKEPPGTAPIIEAPFTFAAPANPMAFFALHHGQPTKPGFIHDLCLSGPYRGEVPKDPRFRFRQFVFTDDAAQVRATGAKYLVFYREQFHGERPFREAERCVAELERRYGAPIVHDARIAVFRLRD